MPLYRLAKHGAEQLICSVQILQIAPLFESKVKRAGKLVLDCFFSMLFGPKQFDQELCCFAGHLSGHPLADFTDLSVVVERHRSSLTSDACEFQVPTFNAGDHNGIFSFHQFAFQPLSLIAPHAPERNRLIPKTSTSDIAG